MFEIVKDEELKKYNIIKESIILPTRKTTFSAGYDISCPKFDWLDATRQNPLRFTSDAQVIINSNSKILLPTGLKCKIPNTHYLQLSLRSSFASKNSILLVNSPGIVDSDYYNNESNDGHIFILLYNYYMQYTYVTPGTAIVQGIILPFLNFGDVSEIRTGGFGSTTK